MVFYCFSNTPHRQGNVYADHPMPLIVTPLSKLPTGTEPTFFVRLATEMASVHNIIIRSLNAIYLQAPYVEAADYTSFINFMHQWYRLLDGHHSGEEATFFPAIEKFAGEKGLMEVNVEQHRAFHDGLETFDTYVQACLRGNIKFKGTEVVQIIDSFSDALVEHLTDEIDTLLDLEKYGEEIMKQLEPIWAKEGEEVMKGLGLTTGLPLVIAAVDRNYENGLHYNTFPPPEAQKPIWVVRNIGYWVHKDWWKFAPCDRLGNLQPLYSVQ